MIWILTGAAAMMTSCNAILGMEERHLAPNAGGSGGAIDGGGGGIGGGGGGSAGSQAGGGGAGGSPCIPTSTDDCYDGPDGTDDVGICHGGTKICQDDGSWGACLDQQLPETENCYTEGDEDCDGVPCSEHIFSDLLGSTSTEVGESIAWDSSGNFVVAGSYDNWGDPTNLGGSNLPNAGEVDVFVALFDSSGAHQWSKGFGSASVDFAKQVAFDSNGDVIVSGTCRSGSIDFGSSVAITCTGFTDTFVAKLDGGTGSAQWAFTLGISTGDEVYSESLALDSSDNIIIGGWHNSGMSGCSSSPTGLGGFVQKRYASGVGAAWTNCYDADGTDAVSAVAVDGSDNVIIGGTFHDQITLEQVWTSPSYISAYLAKLSSSGTPIWSWSLGHVSASSEGQSIEEIAVDSTGAIVASGNFGAAIQLAPGAAYTVTTMAPDVFVAKYDTNGSYLWGRTFSESTTAGVEQYLRGQAVDSSGAVVLTGHFDGTVDFGGGDFNATEFQFQTFLLKLDSNGNHLWSKQFGGVGCGPGCLTFAYDVATSSIDQIAITGSANGAIDFGGGDLTFGGTHDAFIALFHP